MPWVERVHRCAMPDVPPNIGPGSTWQCGDIGTGTCGKLWQWTGGEWVELTDRPAETAAMAPESNAERRTAPVGVLTLG